MRRITRAAADIWLTAQWITATLCHYAASAASAFGDLVVWPIAALGHLFIGNQ